MSFNSSFRMDDPRPTAAPMSAPTSVEFDPETRAGYLDDINLFMAWMERSFLYESGTLPGDTPIQSEDGPSTPVAAGSTFSDNAFLGPEDLTDTNANALAPATVPPFFPDYGASTNGFYFLSDTSDVDLAALITPCKTFASCSLLLYSPQSEAPTNVNLMPPLTRDDTGNQKFSPHACEASASNFVSPSAFFPEPGTPGIIQTGQVSCAPAWDGIPFTSQTQWDDVWTSAQAGMSDIMSDWSWLDDFYINPNAEGPINLPLPVATATTGGVRRVGTVLGKRARESSSSGSSRKRGRPSTSRVLEQAEGSSKRIHHTSATRAQQPNEEYIDDSMMRSSQAHITTIQGLYPHSLLGPSSPQEMVGFLDQEQFEGGASLEMQHESLSMAAQQSEPQLGGSTEGQDGRHPIPSNLTYRELMMLRITEDEARHGAVHAINCKFCLDVALGSWQSYQRHCNAAEDHPAELTFCDQCGDHFARPDSKNRHVANENKDCLGIKAVDAKRKKKTTKCHFDEFNARLEHCLRTGEELGRRFTEIVPRNVASTSKKAPKKKPRGDS
ncbi:hypothetical protein V8E53_006969 [Lactarius tabidus]